ncbi:MAG: IS30 family transposase [Candidatus Coproplasma sp.]
MAKYKHLTMSERIEIYSLLKQDVSIRKIAKALNRDPTTIAKEIKKHLEVKETGCGGRPFNQCKNSDKCLKSGVCGAEFCYTFCYKCSRCNLYCKDFEEQVCERLVKAPYCCNGCPKTRSCHYRKKVYRANIAHSEYKHNLSESRKGFYIRKAEAKRIEQIISQPILHGQSVHHVYLTHKDELTISERSIYTYIDGGVFNLKNIDLPRKVRYRARKKQSEPKIDRHCREGRTYEDYIAYIKENPSAIVQMDTVKGGISGKVLLTLHFVTCKFMLAILRDANTSKSVIQAINQLDVTLGREKFKELFPVLLTDNGCEFSNPARIEADMNGEMRTRVFYCDRNRPDQKGSIEVTHEFIRRIIPRGQSLECYTQEDINLMMSHINSYGRKRLNDISPYDMFTLLYGQGTAELLGIQKIPYDQINLTPNLLKK